MIVSPKPNAAKFGVRGPNRETNPETTYRENLIRFVQEARAVGAQPILVLTDDAGHGPPVIVALNKWDVPGCRPRVDRGALQERYPFIRGFVEMDCKSNRGIVELKDIQFHDL